MYVPTWRDRLVLTGAMLPLVCTLGEPPEVLQHSGQCHRRLTADVSQRGLFSESEAKIRT